MTNYGIKISQDGYDVKTATDTQLVFSSKFDSVASASIVMTGTSSQTSSSTITLHGTDCARTLCIHDPT